MTEDDIKALRTVAREGWRYAEELEQERKRLRGEAAVMRELLRNCLAVISIVEPLTTDEADALADLNQKIERAIGDAKGTLL